MKIRIAAPWCSPNTEFYNGNYFFSARIRMDEADALLAWWAPVKELYSFHGPKLLYCAEPYEVPSVWREDRWQESLQRLPPDEIVRPGHPNPERRIMHDTHHIPLSMSQARNRIERAIAVVSNNGLALGASWDEVDLRNTLITNHQVDLFGKADAWSGFRKRWPFRPAPPKNYCGEIEGTWAADTVIRMAEKYKVAVCLENSCEPYYFTEKFVNAVRSGCIPVYHAHPTVAEGVL